MPATISISCPEELKKRVDAVCEKHGIYRSTFVSQALEYALEQNSVPPRDGADRFYFDCPDELADELEAKADECGVTPDELLIGATRLMVDMEQPYTPAAAAADPDE